MAVLHYVQLKIGNGIFHNHPLTPACLLAAASGIELWKADGPLLGPQIWRLSARKGAGAEVPLRAGRERGRQSPNSPFHV